MIQKTKTNDKVRWDDFEKQEIAEMVFDKFMSNITVPLLNIVKEVCANFKPGKNRKIASLNQVPWLTKMLQDHHRRHKDAVNTLRQEVKKLKSKPDIKPMADDDRIQKYACKHFDRRSVA